MSGTEVKLRDFFQDNGKAVIAEVCRGLYGVDFQNNGEILSRLEKSLPHAIIGSPGLARQHAKFFARHNAPALIVRGDWSNYKLDGKSLYPAQKFRHVDICTPTEASRLGASAFLCDVFLGTSDVDNVEDIRRLQQFVTEGHEIGLPIMANIVIFGSRVDDSNFTEVVGLGLRSCAEIGADVLCFQATSSESVQQVIKGVPKTEILLRVNPSIAPATATQMVESIPNRYKGLIMDGFDLNIDWSAYIESLQ